MMQEPDQAMTALDVIFDRRSINFFDPSVMMSKDDLNALVAAASQAPSAFNLQHWRFVVAMSADARERLRSVAFDQPKITDAAAVFIILGKLDAHRDLRVAFGDLLDCGAMDAATYERQEAMVSAWYDGKEQQCRDEAIRSASLAAMNLMIAATAAGWASCPLVGFDPQALRTEFLIPDEQLPVMLIAVGRPASGNYTKKSRLPTDSVATII